MWSIHENNSKTGYYIEDECSTIAKVTRIENARLIAAAPELLECCIELLKCIQPDRDWEEAKRARLAIAKATSK